MPMPQLSLVFAVLCAYLYEIRIHSYRSHSREADTPNSQADRSLTASKHPQCEWIPAFAGMRVPLQRNLL